MKTYYTKKLSAERLRECYELATPAVQRYLESEIEHVRKKIVAGSHALELGCGYGRVLLALKSSPFKTMIGIDISVASILLAQRYLAGHKRIHLMQMDAIRPGFRSHSFDLVFCIQNGISAFHVDQRELIASAIRMTRPGGSVLFSSYAKEFWQHRLEWFRIQALHGLIGEIDEERTGDGVIVCKDGFTASTVGPEEFRKLCQGLAGNITVRTVLNSSLFCEILV